MARSKRYRSSDRDAGAFCAIPWAVLDSPSYQGLSHPARSLLMEIARQYRGNDNGRMIVTLAYLKPRGWTSNDTIMRAKGELLDAGLIFETCKGRRPNRASWYAVTWMALSKLDGFDAGAEKGFERGAYNAERRVKNVSLIPSHGVGSRSIAPCDGVAA